jgi:hypothetical protein
MRSWCALSLAVMLAACGTDETSNSETGVDAGLSPLDGSATTDGSSSADVVIDVEPELIEPLVDQDDGLPCTENMECRSGTCLTAEEGFPGGFCTYFDCESRRDCAGPGRACLRGEFNGNLCVQLCESDDDCRTGYECVGQGNGSYCYPAYAGEALNPVCDSVLLDESAVRAPIGNFELLNRHEVKFDIADDTTSFMMVAWDRRQFLFPEAFINPTGERIDIFDYASYSFSPSTFQTVSPVLFPGGPQYEDFVEGGEYTALFGYEGGEDDDLCYIIMEESDSLRPDAEPLIIDVNFYFVGVDNLDATSAPDSQTFGLMLEAFDAAYAQANIGLGDVAYYEVIGDVRDEYRIIRQQEAVFDLVQLSRQPGETRSDLLSANVFFIQGFGGEMGGVLGVSAGIPGAAGVHGSQGTGLVFSANSLRGADGARLVGQTLAHEVGHFLGLFHTTEQESRGADQLDDTPECPRDIGGGNPRCPDADNLMFPIALTRPVTSLSDGQILIVRANPLTKPFSRIANVEE